MITEFQGSYRFLSNFWPAEVVYEGRVYPSVEHAYQAAKCANPMDREEFGWAHLTPGQAKRLSKRFPKRADWEQVKVDTMLDLLRQKFTKHDDLKFLLQQTGTQELVEGNTWGDVFWGVCRGKGQNMLGKLLMKVRSELQFR